MKKSVSLVAVSIVLAVAGLAVAHHAAQGIVDEEIYVMIDELVADTPHGLMDLQDLGQGMTEIEITNLSVNYIERIIDDGLLTYASMLDGDVTVQITFGDPRDVQMIILQEE